VRRLYPFFVILCLAFVTVAQWRLHRYTAVDYWSAGSGPDVQAQLNWIGRELRQGAGEQTQSWYPEGFFFAHVIYGYALVNQVLLNPDEPDLRQRNLAEIEWVLAQLESEAGRRPFPQNQSVEYGVFYQGWSNKLLGGLLLLQAEADRDPARVAQFHRQSEALAEAYWFSPRLHLEAYPGGCWPVDNIVALSSLRLHDHLYGSSYGEVVDEWLAYTQANLDPQTGLIPHRIDAVDGRHRQGSRASSLVMSLIFLPELDETFAREQYGRFRELYGRSGLGFVAFREYPPGVNGPADVDSGPLLFGLGPVATGVSMAPARANGDREIFERMLQLSEVVGLPFTWNGEKRYSLGLLPVGDAFLVWSKTILPWRLPAEPPAFVEYSRLTPAVHWFVYGVTAVFLTVLLLPLVRRSA
jgi:hypothetical protein